MALLNEKQIEEVVHIFLQNRDTNAVVIKTAMENWNEKQPSPIEPNWKSLPSKIKYCHLLQYYFDDIGNEIDFEFIIHFERPAPVITPHPHAEIMAKYAEVAARRDDPWVEFEQYSHCDMEWDGLPYHPDWTQGQTYRHIGDDK